MAESGEVLVLGVPGNAFEADENIFEAGEIAAGDGDAAEGFEERSEQGAGFGAFFFGESGERALAELFGNLIGPERFEKRSEFAKAGGNDAAGASSCVVPKGRLLEKNSRSFAARCDGDGIDHEMYGPVDGRVGATDTVYVPR